MREAAGAAAGLARSAGPGHAAEDDLARSPPGAPAMDALDASDDVAAQLEGDARALADLKAAHRRATLDIVASGKLTASVAIARVDAVALLNRLAHHAWRTVAHLEVAAAAPMELDR
jgi:phosphate:Na+ symporter